MERTLAERFEKELKGVLNCYDRVVISGNVQGWCYAKGMTHYLYEQDIRIFDYAKFAEPLRERVRENAEALAKEAGVEIEFIRKKDFRKEARIQVSSHQIGAGNTRMPAAWEIKSAKGRIA